MSRRLSLLLVLIVAAPLIIGPVEVEASDALEHDIENGCGAVGADFVPDNSAVIRAIFGDVTAVPELMRWVNNTDSVDYFTQSCNAHDRCYGTFGASKLDCDWAFFMDLAQACAQAYLTPRSPGFWDLATAGLAWTIEVTYDAVQYTPCVSLAATSMSNAVLLFGWSAYADAQNDARTASLCSPGLQGTYTGTFLPVSGIQEWFDHDCRVVDLAYGDGRWSGVSRQIGDAQSVRWRGTTAEVNTDFEELVSQGRVLTDLEYGDGTWVAVYTGGTGIGGQRFLGSSTFDNISSDIRSAWTEGMAVTELEYGDGRWVMVASSDTGITNQTWERGITSDAALGAMIDSRRDDGWELTILEFEEDEWFAVFSQGTGWEMSTSGSYTTYHDLRVALDEGVGAGWRTLDVEYGHGSWWGVWFLPPEAPATSTPPVTAAPPAPPAFVPVPDVDDDTLTAARSKIVAAGFGFEYVERPTINPVDDGRVVDQFPDAGALRLEGATVTVYIGAYTEPAPVDTTPQRVPVPDVSGLSEASARSRVQSAGLVFANPATESTSDPALVNRVVRQVPASGLVDVGSTVQVWLGVAEWVSVPSVTDLSESTAKYEIERKGLVASRAGTQEVTNPNSVGVVVRQEPAWNTSVQVGSTVRYWIGVASSSVDGEETGDGPLAGSLDYTQGGEYELYLTGGAFGEPYRASSIFFAGSLAVEFSLDGGSCTGYARPEPTVTLHWTGNGNGLRFYVLASGGADAVLVVRAPNGTWYCNDDWSSGTRNPGVTLGGASGEYNIWIGIYNAGGYGGDGDFYVTQLEGHHP